MSMLIFSVLLTVLFLFNTQKTLAADLESYFMEIDEQGTVVRGTSFTPDKPEIRPQYQGTLEQIPKDIVNEKGEQAFKSLNSGYPITKGDTLYYKNVGDYAGRKLSLKMTMLIKGQFYGEIRLTSSGSINAAAASSFAKDGFFDLQLVYQDTKAPVSNVYLQYPQSSLLTRLYENENSQTYDSIELNPGLKKVILSRIGTKAATLVEATSSLSARQMMRIQVPRRSMNNFVGDWADYIYIQDNSVPLRVGWYNGFAYTSELVPFSAKVKSLGLPTYVQPNIQGSELSTLQADYTITQRLVDTYDSLFPDSLTINLKDDGGNFSSFAKSSIKVLDEWGTDITSQTRITNLSTGGKGVVFPNALLKTLQSGNVSIKVSNTGISESSALAVYNEKDRRMNFSISAFNTRLKGAASVNSVSGKGTAQIIPTVSANPISQKVAFGSSTKDLDASKLVSGLKSSLSIDTARVVGFVKAQDFNTSGATSVDVKIESTRMKGVEAIISVPVTVMPQPVTSSFFENQAWIIDEINKQLSPKQIDKDVYMEDLDKITQLNTGTTGDFSGQYIPKNIKALKNLNLLYLKNKKMTGDLPTELGSLTNLKDLQIFGNSFSGPFPDSLTSLTNLETLDLSNNKLTGTIPVELNKLKNLSTLGLNDNQFVGNLVTLSDGFKVLNINNTQLTYNSAELPSFLTSAVAKNFANTFFKGSEELKLVGKAALNISDSNLASIKPFDETDQGNFALQVLSKGKNSALYAGHTFTIKNGESDDVLYEGLADKSVSIPYTKGISYKIILDKAELNPNNQFEISSKIAELKLDSVPTAMSFTIPLGADLTKPVQLTGDVAVFDNRDKGNWQLSLTPSPLKSSLRDLKGAYTYSDSKGIEKEIISGQKIVIETGTSDSDKEVIPISSTWNDKQGLQYKMNGSNYLDKYEGSVLWTLEDVPSSN
ncbi:hypothetical protein RV12_GL002763 [Enterococcus quebecensis]|nr:hypothetical protein RV12_GL002763 [Enterococcus quebecensis]